jgi:hypothetical protein
MENFIGTTSNAGDCKILNKEAVRFRRSRKTNTLTATALEPLVIENRALGYNIHYQLERFNYDYKTRWLIFEGFPFFEHMEGSEGQKKKWEKKRAEVYHGSMMHFMRSLYTNTLVQDGFEIRTFQTLTKPGVDGARLTVKADILGASADDKNFEDLVGDVVPADSIAYAVDKTTAGLDFKGVLLVYYKKQNAPSEYKALFGAKQMISKITLVNQRPIEIQANGAYYGPSDLLATGYWSWSEKTSNLLPLDYKTEKD